MHSESYQERMNCLFNISQYDPLNGQKICMHGHEKQMCMYTLEKF